MEENVEILERKLLSAISKINSQIAALEQEKRSLERVIVKSRRENASQREVYRTSSVSRVIVEQAMLKYLIDIKGMSTDTKTLKSIANSIELHLNDNTFRSYLHRLKIRGLIEPAGHGRWQIAPESVIDR